MQIALKYDGEKYEFVVFRLGMERFMILTEGMALPIRAESMGGPEWRVLLGKQTYRTFSVSNGHTFLIEVNGMPHRITRYEGGILRAPSPSVISAIEVAEGDQVQAGDPRLPHFRLQVEGAVLQDTLGTRQSFHSPRPGSARPGGREAAVLRQALLPVQQQLQHGH